MIQPPCKDCPNRTADCRATCSRWRLYKLCNDRRKEIIDRKRDVERDVVRTIVDRNDRINKRMKHRRK